MNRPFRKAFPNPAEIRDEPTRRVLQALVENLRDINGDFSDARAVVTKQDLVDAGLATLNGSTLVRREN